MNAEVSTGSSAGASQDSTKEDTTHGNTTGENTAGQSTAGQNPTETVAPVQLLRVEDAARVLSIGRSRLYELLRHGELQSVKIGSSRRITPAALQAFVATLDPHRSI